MGWSLTMNKRNEKSRIHIDLSQNGFSLLPDPAAHFSLGTKGLNQQFRVCLSTV